MQILKGLKSQSKAIHTALDAYNCLAHALEPPHPQLNFKDIIEYSSLAEFDLLRDTRGSVQMRPWASQLIAPCWCSITSRSVQRKNLGGCTLKYGVFLPSFAMRAPCTRHHSNLSGTSLDSCRHLCSDGFFGHRFIGPYLTASRCFWIVQDKGPVDLGMRKGTRG